MLEILVDRNGGWDARVGSDARRQPGGRRSLRNHRKDENRKFIRFLKGSRDNCDAKRGGLGCFQGAGRERDLKVEDGVGCADVVVSGEQPTAAQRKKGCVRSMFRTRVDGEIRESSCARYVLMRRGRADLDGNEVR